MRINKTICLLLVAFILLTLISSCEPPRVMEAESDFYYDIDDDDTTTAASKTTNRTKSDETKYQKLIKFLIENGESYVYKYANQDGVTASTYTISQITYDKVVWKEYFVRRADAVLNINYKIGLSYTAKDGIHILCECVFSTTGLPYSIRIIPGSNSIGYSEVVETKAGNDSSALISFDTAKFDGKIKIKNRYTFGSTVISDDFDLTAEYIINNVLLNANKFIEEEITGGNLKIIGIGYDYLSVPIDTTDAVSETQSTN